MKNNEMFDTRKCGWEDLLLVFSSLQKIAFSHTTKVANLFRACKYLSLLILLKMKVPPPNFSKEVDGCQAIDWYAFDCP
jgi:hypothetical protein